jgi:hypothetical protein
MGRLRPPDCLVSTSPPNRHAGGFIPYYGILTRKVSPKDCSPSSAEREVLRLVAATAQARGQRHRQAGEPHSRMSCQATRRKIVGYQLSRPFPRAILVGLPSHCNSACQVRKGEFGGHHALIRRSSCRKEVCGFSRGGAFFPVKPPFGLERHPYWCRASGGASVVSQGREGKALTFQISENTIGTYRGAERGGVGV